jgi:ATP synthase F1 complex assembly factor 2
LVEKAKKFVESLDAWNLAALYSACAESKSFFIGAVLIHEAAERVRGNDSMRDAKWAVLASRVEEEFNIEAWGLVEGGHDYDRLNSSIQMHSAAFLAQAVAHSVSEY